MNLDSSARGTTGIRLEINRSLARPAPRKSTFGSQLAQGASVSSPLTVTLQELALAMTDIEDYARRHSPTLLPSIWSMRAQVQAVAMRSAQTSPPVTGTSPYSPRG